MNHAGTPQGNTKSTSKARKPKVIQQPLYTSSESGSRQKDQATTGDAITAQGSEDGDFRGRDAKKSNIGEGSVADGVDTDRDVTMPPGADDLAFWERVATDFRQRMFGDIRNTDGVIAQRSIVDKGALQSDTDPVDDSVELELHSDSDESVISKTWSELSVASSATTVDEDALEAIFRRLLLFDSLRYLWPQLVTISVSRTNCLRTSERLLRRWSEDLGILATSSKLRGSESIVCLQACRFVRKSRLSIAQRIWEAHRPLEEFQVGVSAGPQTEDILEPPLEDKYDQEDDDNFVYAIAERFLFDTEPIYALQASVKGIVQSHGQENNNVVTKLYTPVVVFFTNLTTTIFEPPVPPRSKRLWWECVGSPCPFCFLATISLAFPSPVNWLVFRLISGLG